MNPSSYFYNSTLLLHITTVIYVITFFLEEFQFVGLAYSIGYTIQMITKCWVQSDVYWSSYYSLGFKLIDLASGPVSLCVCIYKLYFHINALHVESVFIVCKILTCRNHIRSIKQIYYIISSTFQYLVLGLIIFLAFICLTFYCLQDISKQFMTIKATYYTLLQIVTFDDNWTSSVLVNVIKNSNSLWTLYFFFYLMLIQVVYLITMLSFSVVYYSNQQYKIDFSYREKQTIYVYELIRLLQIRKQQGEMKYIKQIYVSYFLILQFFILGIYEIIVRRNEQVRYVCVLVTISIMYLQIIYLVFQKKLNYDFSGIFISLRFIVSLIIFTCSLIFKFRVSYVIVFFIAACMFDLVRSSDYLVDFIQNQGRVYLEFVIIIGTFCYIFGVAVLNDRDLLKDTYLKDKINNLINAVLSNMSLVGYDGVGEFGKSLFNENPIYMVYFITTVFIGGFVIMDVFTGEILDRMEEYVKNKMYINKLLYTEIKFNDINKLAKLCKIRLREYNIKFQF